MIEKRMIPFLEFGRLNAAYKRELMDAVSAVIDSGHYILGEKVAEFEQAFASCTGTSHAIGVGNGLDALCLIFRAYREMGLMKPGDEVIVPSNTYIATILAITHTGLVPVLVEPDLRTYNLDPALIERHVTPRTKAIVAVHLYGQIAWSGSLQAVADKHKLLIVEDAAQAHGAIVDGRKAGNLGDAGAFSLYPSKPLGAVGGDAGVVTTNDDVLAATVRSMRNYGSEKKYHNTHQGVNSRLDEIHAAMLLVKLAHLDEANNARRRIATRYRSEISNPAIILPHASVEEAHVWHLFVTRTHDRDAFSQHLAERGVGSLIHYPVPPHKQAAYNELRDCSFPVSEHIHATVLSIPLHHLLDDSEVDIIVDACNSFG